MSLYHQMKDYRKYSQHKPNALCMWCTDNYDPKDRFCLVKKSVIQEPFQPRRCMYYTGEPVTDENLKSVYELLKAGLEVS